MIRRVDIAREERHRGYRLASLEAAPLGAQLASAAGRRSVALVDDTVFSGLTVESVLDALPGAGRRPKRVFCLRGIQGTLAGIRHRCPVTAGIEAPGRLLEDASMINASASSRAGPSDGPVCPRGVLRASGVDRRMVSGQLPRSRRSMPRAQRATRGRRERPDRWHRPRVSPGLAPPLLTEPRRRRHTQEALA